MRHIKKSENNMIPAGHQERRTAEKRFDEAKYDFLLDPSFRLMMGGVR